MHATSYLMESQRFTNRDIIFKFVRSVMKRKREFTELLFIDVKEGFIQKVDLGYTLVSSIIKLRLHISLSYN